MLAAQSSQVSGIVFVVAVLATSMVLVALLAWASRQLLGLPVGAPSVVLPATAARRSGSAENHNTANAAR